jgi:hypothetical protein
VANDVEASGLQESEVIHKLQKYRTKLTEPGITEQKKCDYERKVQRYSEMNRSEMEPHLATGLAPGPVVVEVTDESSVTGHEFVTQVQQFHDLCDSQNGLAEHLARPANLQPFTESSLPCVDAWLATAEAEQAAVVLAMVGDVMRSQRAKETILVDLNPLLQATSYSAPSTRRALAWAVSTTDHHVALFSRLINLHPSVYGVQYALLPSRM